MRVWVELMRTERLNHIAYLKLVGDAFWVGGGRHHHVADTDVSPPSPDGAQSEWETSALW